MASFQLMLFGIIALIAGYIYLFGIPPQLKRAMERKALETIGENKASYIVKDQISKLPASDQEDVQNVRQGVSNVLGGALQNPLGKEAGELADSLTSSFTDR